MGLRGSRPKFSTNGKAMKHLVESLALDGLACRILLALAGAIQLVSACFASDTRNQLHSKPPNIVLILADDQAWMDFGFMGNQRVHTPNLDALASKSARFPNGYVPSSVCRPSLATILTGLYPHQHGIHFNHGPPGNSGYNRMTTRSEYEAHRQNEFELIQRLETLPKLLAKHQGYRCLQTGKFWEGHYRNAGFTDGMTTFTPPSKDQTFGGIRKLASGEQVAHGNGDHGLIIGRKTMQPIKDFIQDCERLNTPWFVWYAPYLPHLPHDAPNQFQKLAASHPGVVPWEQPYFASIAQFDSTVGELLTIVSSESQPSNTLYVFLSDNGWRPSSIPSKQNPQEYTQTKRSKRAPFDAGVRTPILIRWDGVVSPQTQNGLCSSIDLLPTLLGAAEISTTPDLSLPGINLLDFLKYDKPVPPDRSIFGEIYPGDATSLNSASQDIAYRWIRKGKMKLIIPHLNSVSKGSSSQSNPTQLKELKSIAWNDYVREESLFDLSRDPFEKLNLIGSKLHASHREALKSELNGWWQPEGTP